MGRDRSVSMQVLVDFAYHPRACNHCLFHAPLVVVNADLKNKIPNDPACASWRRCHDERALLGVFGMLALRSLVGVIDPSRARRDCLFYKKVVASFSSSCDSYSYSF